MKKVDAGESPGRGFRSKSGTRWRSKTEYNSDYQNVAGRTKSLKKWKITPRDLSFLSCPLLRSSLSGPCNCIWYSPNSAAAKLYARTA